MACENQKYFKCTSASRCIHPDLVCDGHPQCPGGEDENLDDCHEKYIQDQIVSPYAAYSCKSLFYENVYIYSTPCNNIRECFDGSDEENCKQDKLATYLLIGSSVTVIIFYLALKLYQFYTKDNIDKLMMTVIQDCSLIERFETNHNDPDVLNEAKIYLLRTIISKDVDKVQEICRQFYDLESKVHNGKDSEIFVCLHNNYDPLIVENMVDAKFPGIMARLTSWIEDCIGKRIFTWIENKSKKRSKYIAILTRIMALLVKYVDQFKDTALTIWIITLVGGFQSVIDLPGNFMTLILSILVPLFLSSLHLAVNNPFMIWFQSYAKQSLKIYSEVSSPVFMKFLCLLSSLFNPILLTNTYEQAREEARIMTKYYDYGVITARRECLAIKLQLVQFQRIELGRFVLFISLSIANSYIKLFVTLFRDGDHCSSYIADHNYTHLKNCHRHYWGF